MRRRGLRRLPRYRSDGRGAPMCRCLPWRRIVDDRQVAAFRRRWWSMGVMRVRSAGCWSRSPCTWRSCPVWSAARDGTADFAFDVVVHRDLTDTSPCLSGSAKPSCTAGFPRRSERVPRRTRDDRAPCANRRRRRCPTVTEPDLTDGGPSAHLVFRRVRNRRCDVPPAVRRKRHERGGSRDEAPYGSGSGCRCGYSTTTERSTSPRSMRWNAASTSSRAIVSDTKRSRSKRPCR